MTRLAVLNTWNPLGDTVVAGIRAAHSGTPDAAINTLSLVVDAIDVARYLRGDRRPTVSGLE